MASFEEQMNAWLRQVKKIGVMNSDDKAKVTKAGAQVFRDKLAERTKEKHYEKNVKLKTRKHLADTVTVVNKNIDGEKDGTSTVGFLKPEDHEYSYSYIARFLNDGTKNIKADHFVTNLRSEVKDEVLSAEQDEYKKIIKQRSE